MLVQESFDPKVLAKQKLELEAVTREYNQAHEKFLAGRKLQVIEEQAKTIVSEAKVKAQKILEDAVQARNKVEQLDKEVNEKLQQALSKSKEYDAKMMDLRQKETELQSKLDEAERKQRQAEIETSKAIEKQSQFESRLSEIQKVLMGLVNG